MMAKMLSWFRESSAQNEVILEATSDEKVSQGVIAVAVGSLKSPNIGSGITRFEKSRN